MKVPGADTSSPDMLRVFRLWAHTLEDFRRPGLLGYENYIRRHCVGLRFLTIILNTFNDT